MKHLLRVALSMLLAACAASASAQSAGRAGKWEVTLQPQYFHSQSFDSGNGASAQVGSSLGFGFGIAYNLNNNLALGGDFTWGSASYTANLAPASGQPAQTLNGTLDTSTVRFNVIWNMIATGEFTPFLIAGIGSTYVDTNIPYGGPPVCWYDPWWGYYCSQPTRTAYDVSYSAALGVRWEIDRNIFVRALVNRMWLDVGGALGTPSFDQYRVDLGFKF